MRCDVRFDPAFHAWTHRVGPGAPALVLPDGCRDVIVLAAPGQGERTVITAMDVAPRLAVLPEGTFLRGWRLRPGAVPTLETIAAVAHNPDAAADILQAAHARPGEIEEAAAAFAAPGASVASVVRGLGVSARTAQRRFRELGLIAPEQWRLLGRARRAAATLTTTASLAEIADACGYADQAHLTRDFSRWFGFPPGRARKDGALLDLLIQPGLGAWTGEQISTR